MFGWVRLIHVLQDLIHLYGLNCPGTRTVNGLPKKSTKEKILFLLIPLSDGLLQKGAFKIKKGVAMSKPKILQTSCGVLYLKPSQRFVGETRATIRLLRLGLRVLFKAFSTTNTAEILLKLPRGRVMSLSLHHRMATFQNCNHVPDAIDLGSCWRKKKRG